MKNLWITVNTEFAVIGASFVKFDGLRWHFYLASRGGAANNKAPEREH